MAAKNIFEMLGLEFDPPDNLKKIRAAYEHWKKRLTAEQNTTVETARLEAIKSELAMDNYITQTIENPRLRQHEAESLKQTRIEQLRLYIDIQRGDTSGTLQVNQSQIRQIKDKLKLSIATIEATYKEQGFEVKKARTDKSVTETLNNFFIADSVMAELRHNFAEFQTVPDEQNYPWSAEVNDLYEFAYYIENRIEPSADFYKRRDTGDLYEIFKNEAKKLSSPIPAWHSIKALANIAQTQIFNSDENRFKYDHSLKIEQLSDFFAKLKTAPDVFKRDSYFADNCIARIRRTFPNLLNYELSAALYNKAAGLLKNPYESVGDATENFFCATCSNCNAFEYFRTREEAEKAVCKVCGEKFYIDCPKCGKIIPANSDHCPNCEFSLDGLRHYNYYLERANSMLDLIESSAKSFDGDAEIILTGVMENLANARAVKPESHDLTKIEWRINRIMADFKKRELIRWAESVMPGLKVSPDEAVSRCMEILRKIKGYLPAVQRLKLIKPKKPLSVTAVIREGAPRKSGAILSKISVKAKSTGMATQSINLTCMINWQPANDLGVSYTVVRKVDGIPKNHLDGVIVVENTERLEIEDGEVKPGILYGYAIFATRYENISEPITCTVVHYSNIESNKLIAKTEDGHCKFVWKLPSDNCLGVRILRGDPEGNNVILADCVDSPFVDRSVKNLKQYQYRLQCVYYSAEDEIINRQKFLTAAGDGTLNKVWQYNRPLKYSDGITVTLTPELPPRPVKNLRFNVEDYRVKFNWQSAGDFDLWFKEITDDKKFPDVQSGKVFDLDKVDELLGSGVVLRRAKSSDHACEFDLRGEMKKIVVISATRNFGIVNEIFTVANVETCEIDETNTQINANELKLVLKNLPRNLYMIHYKIAAEDSDEIYATIEDAKSRHMNRIYADKYAQDTFILQSHLPPKLLYITVIGEYRLDDGSTVYSSPSIFSVNNRPKSEISYRLEWGRVGFLNKRAQAKNCRLVIESTAPATPPMYLACRKDGTINIEILQKIPEYKTGLPNGHLEIALPDSLWDKISAGTIIKLFTSSNDEKFFDIKPLKPDSLTVPKK